MALLDLSYEERAREPTKSGKRTNKSTKSMITVSNMHQADKPANADVFPALTGSAENNRLRTRARKRFL